MNDSIARRLLVAATMLGSASAGLSLHAQQAPQFSGTMLGSDYVCQVAFVPHTTKNGPDGLGLEGHLEISTNTAASCKGAFKKKLYLCGAGHDPAVFGSAFCAPDAQFDKASLLEIGAQIAAAARDGAQVDIMYADCNVVLGGLPSPAYCPLFVYATGRR